MIESFDYISIEILVAGHKKKEKYGVINPRCFLGIFFWRRSISKPSFLLIKNLDSIMAYNGYEMKSGKIRRNPLKFVKVSQWK